MGGCASKPKDVDGQAPGIPQGNLPLTPDAVEAIEDPSCPFVLGVLWHPEEDEKSQLIHALVSEVS